VDDGDGDAALRAAIEALYVAFAAHPLKPTTEPCPCCHGPDDERAIHSAPLRDLTPTALAGYAADAIWTWGDVDDLKHLLPRLFEIVCFEGFEDRWPDSEAVFRRLEAGGWSSWPEDERVAVRAVLRAWWTRRLHRSPYEDPYDELVGDVTGAIVASGDDLATYLAEWAASAGRAPVVHFADLYCRNIARITRGEPPDAGVGLGERERGAVVDAFTVEAASTFAPRIAEVLRVERDERSRETLSDALDAMPTS